MGDIATADQPLAPLTFDECYERYFDDVWRAARRLGVHPSSVDDVAQETFVTLFRRIHTHDGTRSMRAFILGILGNCVRTHYRTHRRKGLPLAKHDDELSLIPSSSPDPAARAEQNEAVELVDCLLRKLPEERRTVLLLVEVEGFSVPEVSEMLDVNVNTVYTRLRAARQDFDAARSAMQSGAAP